MKRGQNGNRAFTLVELMVVIAIIAILTGITITSLTGSKQKARDAKRISDLGQVQLALELFFDRCKQYPTSINNPTSGVSGANCPSGINLGTYISQIPTPPSNAASYDYVTNSSYSNYVLHIELEGESEVLKDSLTEDNKQPTGESWADSITCYNGTNKHYCLGPK